MLIFFIVSKLQSKDGKCMLCCKEVKKLESTVKDMIRDKKENEFVLLHYKAQIGLLHDTLKNMKKASTKALDVELDMLESLESKVERGFHLNHTGEEVTYPGEEMLDQYRERKTLSSSASSSSDSLL